MFATKRLEIFFAVAMLAQAMAVPIQRTDNTDKINRETDPAGPPPYMVNMYYVFTNIKLLFQFICFNWFI